MNRNTGMKSINFINPLDSQQRKEIRRWALISGTVIGTVLIGITIVTGYQWHTHHRLHTQNDTLARELNAQSTAHPQSPALSKEHEALTEKVTKLSACTNCPKNPRDLVTMLRKSVGRAPIQSLSITKKNIELKVLCANAKQATTIVQQLSTHQELSHVRLMALAAYPPNQLVATITAHRVKKK